MQTERSPERTVRSIEIPLKVGTYLLALNTYGVNLSAHIVLIYLIRNRIKRLFNETLTPTLVAGSVGGEVTGLERVHDCV